MEKLKIKALCKSYNNFKLDNISFDIPKGTVVGLIGENGAGKSTIIKSILGIVHPEQGKIFFDGKDLKNLDKAERQKIAFVLDDIGLPQEINLSMLNKVLSQIFINWNSNQYKDLIKKLELPEDKLIKNFSKGMKMKVAIAVALSYDSELLIMDEPTSGLDPVVRDEILELIYDYMQTEDRAVLISSHITSDLEKLCDYIIYMHKGKIIFNDEKDEIMNKYALYGITSNQIAELDKSAIVKVIYREYGMDILAIKNKMPNTFASKPIKLEDIMLFYSKGENLC